MPQYSGLPLLRACCKPVVPNGVFHQIHISIGLTICAVSAATPAQTTLPEAAPIAQAVRVQLPPKLDGTIDDPIWQQAIPITDCRQKEPYEGQPATESTEVGILYTHKQSCFGIVCHDSAPHGIVATLDWQTWLLPNC